MEGKTKSGFSFRVDERITQDYRFVRAIAKVRKGDQADKLIAFDEVGTMLLGDDIERLIAHVEELNEGFAPVDKMAVEINEIVEICTPKNSPSSQE